MEDPTYYLEELSPLYEIKELNQICLEYIGDDCKLQNAELMKVDSTSDSSHGSGLFHHDTIGHRLKVYFNFSIEENSRPTWFAKKSHI